MKEQWQRAAAMQKLSKAELERLIQPAFAGAQVISQRFAVGGLANTNIRVELKNRNRPLLLRIFDRDPREAQKEHRIYELVKGKVPSPEIYYFDRNNSLYERPYMIMEFVEGERLEVVAKTLKGAEIEEIGRAVGKALATVHGIKFDNFGFFDEQLNVVEKLDMGGEGLWRYGRRCLIEELGGERLGKDLTGEVLQFLQSEGRILDRWDGEPCLTHSDFGGSNILVARDKSDAWKVAAVLDWEFALSGTPFFDLGNLLRKPLGALAGFSDSVYQGYTTHGGRLPEQWRRMSLMVDLTAWLEFLTRPVAGERLIEDASRTIRETMEEW